MLLITGPTGGTGREIIQGLAKAGAPFRCMVRRPEAADELKAEGFDVVIGDFDRPETLAGALDGVDKAYVVCTPDEQLEAREKAFIDAAVAAGVSHVVKLSAFWADDDSPSPNLRAHRAIEKHLEASGVAYTILRPHGFFQTVFWMSAPTIEAQGIMAAPAGDGPAPYLDIRDVAAAAIQALTEPGHENQVYELTGPESIDMHAVAGALSKGLGKPIQYVDLPEEQMVGGLNAMGVAQSSITHVVTIFRWIREKKFDFTTDGLERLGVSPRSWDDFAADLAAGKTGAATSFKAPPGGPPPGGPPPGGPPPGGPPAGGAPPT